MTLLGVDLVAPTKKIDKTQGVLMRRCDCLDKNGFPAPLNQCVGKGAYCDWTHPDDKNSVGHWQPMLTTQSSSSTPVPPDTTTNERFATGASYTVWRRWDWLQDLQASTGCSSVSTCSTHSAIVAHVSNTNGAVFSGRDTTHDLRDTFTVYDEPNWVNKGTPIYSAPVNCIGPNCVKVVLRPQNMGDPGPDWRAFLRSPSLVELTATSVALLRADGDPADLTGSVSARFRSTLSDGTPRLWLTAVEPGYRIRAREGELEQAPSALPTVGLPSALAWNTYPVLVTTGPSGLDAITVGRSATAEGETATAALASSAAVDPAATIGYDAVFSALDAAIYVVGGAVNGHASGSIAKIDVRTGIWSSARPFPSKIAPSFSVLSTAYDQSRQQLYVLDVEQEGVFRTARLVRYDLRTGDATKLLTWPYLHVFQSVRIASMDSGAVALVAANTTGYLAWKLDVSSLKAKFLGLAVGSGAVVDRPLMGDLDLIVPVWRQGRLAFDALTSSSFLPGAPCSTL